MRVEIDRKSGFCFGVQNAVEVAEKALLKGEKVFSLGPIVHNDKEVERLSKLGLVTIDHDQFRKLSNCKVLIRAHGEPPETYQTAGKNNITIIEATCPIVKRLQVKIKDTWLESENTGKQIVIFGKKGHAEVVGLLGQTGNRGILVTGPADIGKIDFTKPVSLYSQTTMNADAYLDIAHMIRSEMQKAGKADPVKDLAVHNTICGQVSNRGPHLKSFASSHDIIIFVSGKESSNGKMLYSVCKGINPDTYFVSSREELDISWFKGKKSAGVCGATSTPKWLIEEIYEMILKI